MEVGAKLMGGNFIRKPSALTRLIVFVLLLLLAGGILLSLYSESLAVDDARIVLDPRTTYQVISGWEATAQAGQTDFPTQFAQYHDSLFDEAVNDLGINQLRLEVGKPAGSSSFDLNALDDTINKVVIPVRKRLAARGETLYLDLCVVGNGFSFVKYGTGNAAAFASAMVALYQHMQSSYGFVPDSLEILEPDTFGWRSNVGSSISANSIGDIYAKTGDALVAAGFTPRWLVTSDSGVATARTNLSQIWNDANLSQRTKNRAYTAAASFHNYGNADDTSLLSLATTIAGMGLPAVMLEHIGADYNELHRLLKLTNVSAFAQYTLAYANGTDNGAQYYLLNGTTPTIANRTKFLRQYFKYIRRGAVRIGASSTNTSFDPLAFINTGGQTVVVVKAAAGGSFSIEGLPAGTYGIKFTTSKNYNVDQSDVEVSSGAAVSASIPDAGVVTVYLKASRTQPTPLSVPLQTATARATSTVVLSVSATLPATAPTIVTVAPNVGLLATPTTAVATATVAPTVRVLSTSTTAPEPNPTASQPNKQTNSVPDIGAESVRALASPWLAVPVALAAIVAIAVLIWGRRPH